MFTKYINMGKILQSGTDTSSMFLLPAVVYSALTASSYLLLHAFHLSVTHK